MVAGDAERRSVLAFRFMLNGRARQMGLGPLHAVSLAEAREKARLCRRQLIEGIDPIEARQASVQSARADTALGRTFRQCADSYIGSHEAGWKSDKHRSQWTATLETYAYPSIGALSVATIETGHICKILEPIWTTKPETASRVRGRVERILDWATARGLRSGDNPARWRGHLDKLLPQRSKVQKVRHHPALPWQDVPAFMAELRANTSLSARALEFTILTGARTGETLGATWDEIDLETLIWTIPASRMKPGREHRVPLCASAVALLNALSRVAGNDHLFPGSRPKRPLSNMAMLELLRGMRPGAGLTVHGFRSSLRDWAGEATHHAREVIEAALAHAIADKTEAAYRRGDALEKRRILMEDWCRFCGGNNECEKAEKRAPWKTDTQSRCPAWLELMHPHVIALRSKRKAAALIALRHQHEIPLGSAHQRTLTSTIDLLRHKYAEWRKTLAEAEAEAVRARAQQTLGQMAEAAAVIQAATAEYQPVLGRLTADFDKVLNEPRMQAMRSIAQSIKPDAALKAFGDPMEPSVLGQLQGVAERASRLFPHDLMNQIPQFKVRPEFAEIFSPEYSQSLRNMGQALEAVMGPTLKPFEKP